MLSIVDLMITNRLSTRWRIPAYAQPFLFINGDANESSPIAGDTGEFSLETQAQLITVGWGSEAGAPLTQLAWQADSLDWTGTVRLGGFVTSIHFTELAVVDMALAIMTMEAYPLKPSVVPFLSPQERTTIPYMAPDFLDGVDDETDEGVTTWIAEMDSPLVGLMQDALNQDTRIYAFGQLATEEQGWHTLFALPILLESVTVFMN